MLVICVIVMVLSLLLTVECSSSKGLRASSLSTYTKLYARKNARIPSETLITATLCYAMCFISQFQRIYKHCYHNLLSHQDFLDFQVPIICIHQVLFYSF